MHYHMTLENSTQQWCPWSRGSMVANTLDTLGNQKIFGFGTENREGRNGGNVDKAKQGDWEHGDGAIYTYCFCAIAHSLVPTPG